MLSEANVNFEETKELESKMNEIDVLYMTRVQQERFESEAEYEKVKGVYVLTPELVAKGEDSMRILHPLPRIDEITPEVDGMPQVAYFRQAENAVYMRMALLKYVMENAKPL